MKMDHILSMKTLKAIRWQFWVIFCWIGLITIAFVYPKSTTSQFITQCVGQQGRYNECKYRVIGYIDGYRFATEAHSINQSDNLFCIDSQYTGDQLFEQLTSYVASNEEQVDPLLQLETPNGAIAIINQFLTTKYSCK